MTDNMDRDKLLRELMRRRPIPEDRLRQYREKLNGKIAKAHGRKRWGRRLQRAVPWLFLCVLMVRRLSTSDDIYATARYLLAVAVTIAVLKYLIYRMFR